MRPGQDAVRNGSPERGNSQYRRQHDELLDFGVAIREDRGAQRYECRCDGAQQRQDAKRPPYCPAGTSCLPCNIKRQCLRHAQRSDSDGEEHWSHAGSKSSASFNTECLGQDGSRCQ
ncbi:hypothetical protein D3C73_1280330 [compost metagenome]